MGKFEGHLAFYKDQIPAVYLIEDWYNSPTAVGGKVFCGWDVFDTIKKTKIGYIKIYLWDLSGNSKHGSFEREASNIP